MATIPIPHQLRSGRPRRNAGAKRAIGRKLGVGVGTGTYRYQEPFGGKREAAAGKFLARLVEFRSARSTNIVKAGQSARRSSQETLCRNIWLLVTFPTTSTRLP